MLDFVSSLGMYRAGLKIHYVDVKGKTFCYAERGTPSSNIASIIFIHGFTASKDNWLSVVDVCLFTFHLSVQGNNVVVCLIFANVIEYTTNLKNGSLRPNVAPTGNREQ